MLIRECSAEDVPRLAVMNKQLIEDEGSGNPMTVPELEERMRDFLNGEYRAFFFIEEEMVLGYALVRFTSKPLYLRQFFIDRGNRRRHAGQQAFRLLLEHLEIDTIDLDVLPWNRAGLSFWKSCGLTETCISMRYRPGK